MLNGQIQGTNQAINVYAFQLSSAYFQASGTDTLWARVSDGQDFSSWQKFTVTAPVDAAPVIAVGDTVCRQTTRLRFPRCFQPTIPDGDKITKYQLWDSTSDATGGHFMVNGQVQSTGAPIEVSANPLTATFVTGALGTTDDLWIRAFDGINWGSWYEFQVSTSTTMRRWWRRVAISV